MLRTTISKQAKKSFNLFLAPARHDYFLAPARHDYYIMFLFLVNKYCLLMIASHIPEVGYYNHFALHKI